MIVEGLAFMALAGTLHGANKSLEMDERALAKYARAFERQEEAALLIRKKEEYMDKRLANVAKKKRAIINHTVPKFMEVYGQIQKIELEKKNKDELAIMEGKNIQKIEFLDHISVVHKKNYTDKELVCGLLTRGLGKLMVMDSERYMAAANSQMRASNVAYAQAESVAEVYDAIVGRADRIANVLMKMNVLFVKSIQETEATIARNGLNVRNYSEYDKGVLMTCVNLAAAVSDMMDVPVVDEKGQVSEAAMEMIQTGEAYIAKMSSAMENGI